LTSTDFPKVSIITPVFNGAGFIEECIQNVLAQQKVHVEHVIIDGASQDATVEIIKRYADRFPGRIVYLSEPDIGPCDAWNKGWRMASGEIIGWLGCDDRFKPDAVLKAVTYFKNTPDAFFVAGDGIVADEKGRALRIHRSENRYNICTPASFYKAEVISRIGCMETSIYSCDYEYWERVADVYKIDYLRDILVTHTIHKDSVSGALTAPWLYAREKNLRCRWRGDNNAYRSYLRCLDALIRMALLFMCRSHYRYFKVRQILGRFPRRIKYFIGIPY